MKRFCVMCLSKIKKDLDRKYPYIRAENEEEAIKEAAKMVAVSFNDLDALQFHIDSHPINFLLNLDYLIGVTEIK